MNKMCIGNNNYIVYNNVMMIKGCIYRWDEYINKLSDEYEW